LAELPGVLGDLEGWPPAADDRFFTASHRHAWCQRSRLLALAVEFVRPGGGVPGFAYDSEALEVGRRSVRRFADAARAAGAAHLDVHYPSREELRESAAGRWAWHEPLHRALTADGIVVVRPEDRCSPWTDADFQPRGHCGPRLQAKVAEALVDPV